MHKFKVRFIADTNSKRERGLMWADPLQDDEAVLFIFPYTDRHCFWNKNVSFPLSLAFLNEQGIIVDIKDMEADSTERCEPNGHIRYVIEAKKGAFDKNDIGIGDIVKYVDHELHVHNIKQ